MYKTDKVAILMATYNGEKYIREQIDSLLNQSYQEWELFIHDDGSKDGTTKIIQKYSDEYSNKIHIVQGNGTGGAKNNFIFLMRNIDAPYIMFCDQDDVWLNDKIEKTYKRMLSIEKKKSIDIPVMVFTDLKVVNQELGLISEKMSKFQKLDPKKIQNKDVLIQNVITGCTIMINRACLKKSLVDMDVDSIIMHDWWCALVASYFGIISFVDESLILYRQHGGNSVGAKAISSAEYLLDKVKKISEVRKSLDLTRKQAAEFADSYNLDTNSLSKKYSSLSSKIKPYRIIFYFKNNMWKSGLIRNIGLIIWG